MVEKIFQDALFAAIAAIGFAAISRPPRRAYVYCALIGGRPFVAFCTHGLSLHQYNIVDSGGVIRRRGSIGVSFACGSYTC
jgi:uncharacterized membrane protein YjjB (DUF3815 family)